MAGHEEKQETISSIVGNMALAHEMIMTDNFQLKSIDELSGNSLEKNIHDILHQAFWDVLESEVSSDPPQYGHVLNLLMEMKQLIIDILHPSHKNLHKQIDEILDDDLIRQQVANNAFDLAACTHYILTMITKLCAPVRDERIKELKELTGIVPLLRGTFEVLNLMKMDMANYEIQTLKPLLVKQAVEFETQKFAEYLKHNANGLQLTTIWLQEAYNEIKSLQNPDSPTKITPVVVITHAYLSLIEAKEDHFYCETLLMDEVRLRNVTKAFIKLLYAASILTLSYNYIGSHLSTDKEFSTKLKDKVLILLNDSASCNISLLENIFLQIATDTDKELEKKGFGCKKEEDRNVFKGQMESLTEVDNQFKLLIRSRLRDYVLLSITPQVHQLPTSLVLLPLKEEVKTVVDQFVRVIRHNQNVYQGYYNDIINSFLFQDKKEEDI